MSENRTDAVSLIVLVLGYGAYAWAVLAGGVGVAPLAVGEAVALYLALTVGMIFFHALVGITVKLLLGLPDARVDKARERLLDARSALWSYGVLMTGVWAVPFLMMLPDGPALAVHAIVAMMGAAEIVRHVARLVLRGFDGAPNQRALAS